MNAPSEIAQRAAGTFVEDVQRPLPSVLEWIQKECRGGALRPFVEAFANGQQEFLNPALVLVEKLETEMIQCVIPCRVGDHESRSTFASEVRFTLNPKTGVATRLLLPA